MKKGGLTPWNVSVIFVTYKISCLMGGHHMRCGSEYHLKVWLYRLEQWSKVTLSLRRTYRDYINSVLKSCKDYSLDMRCTRCLERRRTEIHATKPKAKEVSTPMNGDNLKIPNRGWNSQSLWRRSASENIHLDPGSS